MSEKITELHIFNGSVSSSGYVFATSNAKEYDKYEIPLYQRAYAWKESEIVQLINDIYYIDDNRKNYYLGSLVVAKNEHAFEVIDGQQRLTTLFIILKCLGFGIKNSLTFSCRDKSNYTLKNLNKLDDATKIEESIRQGRDIVKSAFLSLDKSRFVSNLQKAILFRIEVPKHTDLNRYFEIMNTRGEQLEQHDILKATLMSALSDDTEKEWFATIWDACSNMTGYVQMNFDTSARKTLFGPHWVNLPCFKLSSLGKRNQYEETENQPKTFDDIIKGDISSQKYDGVDENDNRIRFNSIIEFPYFLLHCLNVFINHNKISHKNGEQLIDRLLDDKRLTSTFSKVIESGIINGKDVNKEWFSKEFILCLLKCRFLFDKYIIKREFANDDLDGEWSLKELMQSTSGKSAKAYYVNTVLKGKQKQTKRIVEENRLRAKRVLMLQACYRVSYTSPKVMHWITTLLTWLYENDSSNIISYEEINEKIAQEAVKNNFLKDENFRLGVSTPHIVFNYLDYLLWKQNPDVNFVFEFRNSVEHWYPQNPSSETFDSWDDVDYFGNLCIIQRETNAKFSNLDPEGKKTTFEKMIEKGSLKLRLMSNLTNNKQDWKNRGSYSHGDEMIKILKEACN